MGRRQCASIFMVAAFILLLRPFCFADKPIQKHSEVRLQNNGWIKIIDQFVQQQSAEEFYGENMMDIFKGRIIRRLHVKIMFLKYCKATTKWEDWLSRNPSPGKSVLEGRDEEAQYIFNLGIYFSALKEGNEEAAREMMKEIEERFPSYDRIEYVLPAFRCSYRTKVFATFFSPEGYEIQTKGVIPHAPWTDSFPQKRKTEMVPGETTWVTFFIPDKATAWQVWVPK